MRTTSTDPYLHSAPCTPHGAPLPSVPLPTGQPHSTTERRAKRLPVALSARPRPESKAKAKVRRNAGFCHVSLRSTKGTPLNQGNYIG